MTDDWLSSGTSEGEREYEERSDGGVTETGRSGRAYSSPLDVATDTQTDRSTLGLVIATQVAWMLVTLGGTLGFGIWTPRLYYILSFIGLLVVSLLYVPADRSQTWWVALRWLVRAGFLVLGYIVFRRAESILGPIIVIG